VNKKDGEAEFGLRNFFFSFWFRYIQNTFFLLAIELPADPARQWGQKW